MIRWLGVGFAVTLGVLAAMLLWGRLVRAEGVRPQTAAALGTAATPTRRITLYADHARGVVCYWLEREPGEAVRAPVLSCVVTGNTPPSLPPLSPQTPAAPSPLAL